MNKINKKAYIWGLLPLSILLYISCIDNDIVPIRTSSSAYLSISEAQEFFENSFTTTQTRSRIGKRDNGKLDPGEFTPQWDKAVISENKNVGSVDIPLLTEYKYKAVHCKFENGNSKAYLVDVTQKLVVLKSKHTQEKVQYILTLIPEKDYYQKHKGDISANFTHSEEKNGYSGLAIYTHAMTAKIISISQFQNGKLLKNVFLPSGKDSFESRIKRANKLLDGIKVPRIKNSVTRSFGEGDIIDGGCVFCGQDYGSCSCDFIVDAECQCGSCDLCLSRLCSWCGQNPCICYSYCPICGFVDCICDELGCVFCGKMDCYGECLNTGMDCGGCGVCANCLNTQENYEELGYKTLNRIENDLKNGIVEIKQVNINAGEAILTGVGFGVNTNGIITSCLNFIENAKPSALAFGNAVAGVGLVVGATQTWIGYSDGDITTQDKLNLISTALNAAGIACAFVPGGQIVSGVLGVTSCIVGLVSVFVTNEIHNEIHLQFEDGTSFHMYLVA